MTAKPYKKAIVIGGSMAGLLSARVLSDHFEQVVLIERDGFPEGIEQRKGVPQGQHLHALLAKGEQVLSALFPGLVDDLVQDGAIRFDFADDLLWFQEGGYKKRHPSGIVATAMSRPLLEHQVRRRVLALENVTRLDPCDVRELIASADQKRVTGVKLQRRVEGAREESLTADLIVDATGRGSRSPQWLESLRYPRPQENMVKIDVGYASRIFRYQAELLPHAKGIMTIPALPNIQRGGMIAPLEGNRWIATLAGWLGDHPPADEKGFLEFARSLANTDIYQVISRAEPLGGIVSYKLPSNLRRHYEKMSRFPEGYLVIGDAICSFNPVYGQGMTVSAMEADLLDRCLQEARRRSGLTGLARSFFKQAATVIETPWTLAVGEDFRFPGVEGVKAPGTDMINSYVSRLHRSSLHDEVTTRAFFEVMNLLSAPTSLFHPRIAWRVIKGGKTRRKGNPSGLHRTVGQKAG